MRVAICDQLEDPKLTKKIVKRGVTELVTPGVSYNDKVLENKENNFLCSLQLGEKVSGIAFLDISTGEFYAAQGNNDYIDKLLQGFKPSEVVIQKSKRERFQQLFGSKFYTYTFDDWVFTEDFANDILTAHFGTTSLKGFGVEDMPHAVVAAGGLFITWPKRITIKSSISLKFPGSKKINTSGSTGSLCATWSWSVRSTRRAGHSWM